MKNLNLNLKKGLRWDLSRRRLSGNFRRFKGLIIIVCFIFIPTLLWSLSNSNGGVFQFLFSRNSLKSTDNRVNVLLLGIGGGNHDGADLTDSIIVASYNLKNHNVTLFSIPRDMWLPNINEKINAAYEIGKAKGMGLSFTEDKIDDVLGVPIHYAVLMDFSGFSKAIDLVGGVDVNVPETFDDYEYPIDGKENDLCGLTEQQMTLTDDQAKQYGLSPGLQKVLIDSSGKIATDSANFDCRFEHIHFDKGPAHLDGLTALKFVRSRHALGPEGTDFARSRRQQLVLQSFREKALSLQTISNPAKVAQLWSTFGQSVLTDIPTGEIPQFYSLAKNVSKTNSLVLGDLGGGKSLFINPPPSDYGGAWVLTPPGNNEQIVIDFVKQTLNQDNQSQNQK